MALDTYANLKLELAAWTSRQDTSVTSGGIDTYIDLAESWLNRNLRVKDMVTVQTSLTVSAGGVVTHPTGWLAWKKLYIPTTPITVIAPASENDILNYDRSNAVGRPTKYVVRGTTTQLWPAPDATYQYDCVYYKNIVPLDGTNTSNWLLTSHPDIYLFGALSKGYASFQDDARAGGWEQVFRGLVSELQASSAGDEFSTDIGLPVLRNVV